MTLPTIAAAAPHGVVTGGASVTAGASVDDGAFRAAARTGLRDRVVGEYAALAGRGGPGDADVGFDAGVEWERQIQRSVFGERALGLPREPR